MKLEFILPGRTLVGAATLMLLISLLAVDLVNSAPIDPYLAPHPIALGSGQAPKGAHCTNVTGT